MTSTPNLWRYSRPAFASTPYQASAYAAWPVLARWHFGSDDEGTGTSLLLAVMYPKRYAIPHTHAQVHAGGDAARHNTQHLSRILPPQRCQEPLTYISFRMGRPVADICWGTAVFDSVFTASFEWGAGFEQFWTVANICWVAAVFDTIPFAFFGRGAVDEQFCIGLTLAEVVSFLLRWNFAKLSPYAGETSGRRWDPVTNATLCLCGALKMW